MKHVRGRRGGRGDRTRAGEERGGAGWFGAPHGRRRAHGVLCRGLRDRDFFIYL